MNVPKCTIHPKARAGNFCGECGVALTEAGRAIRDAKKPKPPTSAEIRDGDFGIIRAFEQQMVLLRYRDRVLPISLHQFQTEGAGSGPELRRKVRGEMERVTGFTDAPRGGRPAKMRDVNDSSVGTEAC